MRARSLRMSRSGSRSSRARRRIPPRGIWRARRRPPVQAPRVLRRDVTRYGEGSVRLSSLAGCGWNMEHVGERFRRSQRRCELSFSDASAQGNLGPDGHGRPRAEVGCHLRPYYGPSSLVATGIDTSSWERLIQRTRGIHAPLINGTGAVFVIVSTLRGRPPRPCPMPLKAHVKSAQDRIQALERDLRMDEKSHIHG